MLGSLLQSTSCMNLDEEICDIGTLGIAAVQYSIEIEIGFTDSLL